MIDPPVLSILQSATIKPDRVILNSEQLERGVYEQVDVCLRRIGGKWKGGKTRAHIFPYDPAPLMQAIFDTGELPPDNPLAYFPTPKPIVDRCIELASIWNHEGVRVLEPSAGQGAIAMAIRTDAPRAVIDVVELDTLNASILERRGFNPHRGSFLEYHGAEYDRIVMNPPFSVEGDATAYITHIYHAWSMLAHGGTLVAIAPTGWRWREDAKHRAFERFVYEHGDYEIVERGAFKESGTMIETCIIVLHKHNNAWRYQPCNGFANYDTFMASLIIDNDPALVASADRQSNAATMKSAFENVIRRHNRDAGASIIVDLIDWQDLFEHIEEA